MVLDAQGRIQLATPAAPGCAGPAVVTMDQQTVVSCVTPQIFGPVAIAISGERSVVVGRTQFGIGVPGVDTSARIAVAGIDVRIPEVGVAGLWNELYPAYRPVVSVGNVVSVYSTTITRNSTVRLDGAELPLLYAGPGQINARIPHEAPTGFHVLTIDGSVEAAVDVVARWPGLYDGALNQDGALNSEANPAPRGTIISLFGAGFGPEPLPLIEPYIASHRIGGAAGMQVFYAGRAPGFDGLYK
jgi:hypothetical protein